MLTFRSSVLFTSVFSEENLFRIFEERVSDAKFIGLDGVSAEAFGDTAGHQIQTCIRKIHAGTYCFTRYREKLILKRFNKYPRQIAIPTIRDTIVLRALCDYLTECFPECRMKPPHDTIKRLSTEVRGLPGDHNFLRMDVVNFYPSIVHETLVAQLAKHIPDALALSLVRNAISTPIGFDGPKKSSLGVPQGLSISNILSMIYLKDFDFAADLNYTYFRYVDDIVVVAHESKVEKIHSEVCDLLKNGLGLEVHPLEKEGNKTVISSVDDGTDYLGYNIRNDGLSIRETSYRKMFRAIIGCLRALKGRSSSEQVLWKLNLLVTGCRFENRSVGWVFFFRQTEDFRQLHRMDAFVAKQMGIYGLAHMRSRVKSFVKTYREIRYNRKNTRYIPDFDNFTLADKVSIITLIRGYSEAKIGGMGREEIQQMYWDIVSGQVAKMERESVDFGAGSGGY